jgi:hypothetical protein
MIEGTVQLMFLIYMMFPIKEATIRSILNEKLPHFVSILT